MHYSQKQILWKKLKPIIPRVLTQLDRDSGSPTYGSFDRNFWNYKIRDFSSAILQQGSLFLYSIYNLDVEGNSFYKDKKILEWVQAGVDFWCKIQLKGGGFNEYYPNESGYPPTAFSLYSMAVLANENAILVEGNVKDSFVRASRFLIENFESRALNQQGAGLSALMLSKKFIPGAIDEADYEEVYNRFFSYQSEEGWFPEYDGADVGYLSVTLDCLIDLYRFTSDQKVIDSIKRSIVFLNDHVDHYGNIGPMVNSRNTEYIVPYAIAYLSNDFAPAKELLSKLLSKVDKDDFYLNKGDDRYLCHYIGHSFMRSVAFIKNNNVDSLQVCCNYSPESGFFSYLSDEYSYSISLSKGGVVYKFNEGNCVYCNTGVAAIIGGRLGVSHWQNPNYKFSCKKINENSFVLKVEGELTTHKRVSSSPFKHLVLRGLSLLFGNKLIPILKKIFIFDLGSTNILFIREISITGQDLRVTDEIKGDIEQISSIELDSRYSLRHVSSAGAYRKEESLPPTQYKVDKNKDFIKLES